MLSPFTSARVSQLECTVLTGTEVAERVHPQHCRKRNARARAPAEALPTMHRVLPLFFVQLTASRDDGSTYSLYRNSVTSEAMRLHVATFDSGDGENYNRENCDVARELFQKQPGVRVRFWCEKGKFRR